MKNRKIYPWIVVGLLWFVALLNYMDRQMLSTMKDAMQIDIIELAVGYQFWAANGSLPLDLRSYESDGRNYCRSRQS